MLYIDVSSQILWAQAASILSRALPVLKTSMTGNLSQLLVIFLLGQFCPQIFKATITLIISAQRQR